MTDMVNRPAHYVDGRKYEPINVIEDWGLNYRLGCALKYIARAGRKDPSKVREDLQKCAWYLEREIAALDRPSQYVPADVQYEDVLEYYGQSIDLDEAWPQSVPFDATDSVNDFWMETPDYVTGWDDSLGPIEIEPEEIQQRLAKKDLNQFADDEIVSTIERRGMIIGFRKDGTSCLLKDGRCE